MSLSFSLRAAFSSPAMLTTTTKPAQRMSRSGLSCLLFGLHHYCLRPARGSSPTLGRTVEGSTPFFGQRAHKNSDTLSVSDVGEPLVVAGQLYHSQCCKLADSKLNLCLRVCVCVCWPYLYAIGSVVFSLSLSFSLPRLLHCRRELALSYQP